MTAGRLGRGFGSTYSCKPTPSTASALWAQSAEAVEGVGLHEYVEPKPRPKRPAVIGFQTAGELSTSSPEEIIPDSPAMTYIATPFGERVSRLYLDPLSG